MLPPVGKSPLHAFGCRGIVWRANIKESICVCSERLMKLMLQYHERPMMRTLEFICLDASSHEHYASSISKRDA